MSLGACIPGMVERGEIDPQRAARMKALFDKLERHYASKMSPAAAAAQASERTLQTLAAELADTKRRTLLQHQAQDRLRKEMATFQSMDVQAAALAVLDHDFRGRASYSNVAFRNKAIMGQAHGMIAGILERHGRGRLTGQVRNKADLDDLVREAFGEASDNDSAAALSGAFGEASEWLRRRFNAAGGSIGKMDRWGLPTKHDSLAVRTAAKDDPIFQQLEVELRAARQRGDRAAADRIGEAQIALSSRRWRDQVIPRLDRSRMIDDETGEAFTDAALDQVLDRVYRTIHSEGWATRATGGMGKSSLAAQRAEHRFLHFKSADDWLWYNDRFGGGGGAFEAMVGHLEGMARDIAHLEILGPNPAATVKWLKDEVDRAHHVSPGLKRFGKKADSFLNSIDQLYATTSGALSSPVDSDIARRFASVRSLLVSAQLGSATISAITDMGWGMMTRLYNGMPVTGQLRDFARQFGAGERRASIRAGLIAEDASRLLHASNRFVENEAAGATASWLAERVMNLSLLSQWTQASKWSFGMGFMGHLADMADRPLDQVPKGFQQQLRRYGFSEADWDGIRSTALHEPDGRALLRPQDVADRRLGERLLEMILTETDAAVPSPTARGRAMLSFGQRPGSMGGEAIRSIGQYKSFGVSLLLIHGGRMMAHEGFGGRAAYAAQAMMFGTMLGGLALWLRDVRNGQDPRPADTPGFWGQAVLQGVGFGPFGDYINAVTSERTNSLEQALAGATTGGLSDLGKLLGGNAAQAIGWMTGPELNRDGAPKTLNEQTGAGREVVDFAKRYAPGTNLWYLRTAVERNFFDQMQKNLDANYEDSWEARERGRVDRGSPSWWEAGEPLPGRAPNWSNALGAEE